MEFNIEEKAFKERRRRGNEFESILGKWFDREEEKSVELSGGQWQKVALARTFMRSLGTKVGDKLLVETLGALDAQVLILDEPTAALDAQAEYDMFNRFREMTHGKTNLLISHRFSTVKMADHILVLDSEKIIEQGSHAELIKLNGEYARLYNLQAEKYKD